MLRLAKKMLHNRIAKLIGFYLTFYTCLAAIFLSLLALYLNTLDYDVPRFYGTGSIAGNKPGIAFMPRNKDEPDNLCIRFKPNEKSSYKKYTDSLQDFLSRYDNTTNTRVCAGNSTNNQIVRDGRLIKRYFPACRFNETSSFYANGCGPSDDFGYVQGQPCVALSLNRLIGWKPEDFSIDEVPQEIADRYKNGSIAFLCQGVSDWDAENIGEIDYLPSSGLEKRFYPYAVMPNYHQPIAMVKFKNVTRNHVVHVECRAYAKNIVHDVMNRLGLVRFEIFVEKSEDS